MKSYKQLTQDQRYTLYNLRKIGFTQKKIASILGCHRSTIYREIKRNGLGDYRPLRAHNMYLERKANNRPPSKRTPEMEAFIRDHLEKKWSPEQIKGHCKRNGIDMVSHESIYQFIYHRTYKGEFLHYFLRRKVRKRKDRKSLKPRRSLTENRPMIADRPDEVDQKSRMGDWEGDLIVGFKGSGFILTLVERVSKYTLIGFCKSRESKVVTREIVRLFKQVPQEFKKTLTLDNGSEFAQFKNIRRRCKLDVYYANPYASWERGLNENTNGLIRQYFPKRSSFKKIERPTLNYVQEELNKRPRKTLHYQTPYEIYHNAA